MTPPISHDPIVGGFCLGAHETHCRATNSVMAQITAERKRVGNSDLWFLLIWHLIENGCAPQARDVLPRIREHLLFRMRRHLRTITVTNVPYFPITLVPMEVGCLCTISAIVCGVPENVAIGYLKCHDGHIDLPVKTLYLLEFPIPDEATALLSRQKVFDSIHGLIKARNVESIGWGVRAAHRVVSIDSQKITNATFHYVPDCIPIDGEAPGGAQVREALQHLSDVWKQLDAVGSRAAAQMMELFDVGQIQVSELRQTPGAVNWSYGTRCFKIPDVPICPATCRPYHLVKQPNSEWYQNRYSVIWMPRSTSTNISSSMSIDTRMIYHVMTSSSIFTTQ
jgi:hypothetical protein